MNNSIKEIDKKLNILFNTMDYQDYLLFIYQNKYLKRYDDILGKVDINYYPKIYKLLLTKNFLLKVDDIVTSKLKDLSK